MALLSGISEAKIIEVKRTEIHEKVSQSIRKSGWLPNLFRSIVSKANDFLQCLIRQQDMPPKPTLDIDMAEFRIMRNLMIRVQDRAREIRSLQDNVLPKLKQQISETKGVFKGKERKVLTEQIQQMETKISAMLDALPDILKDDGYPDVRASMTAYREAEAVVEQYNRDLAEWERKTRESRKPAEKNGSDLPKKRASETGSGSYRRRASKNPDADPLTEKGNFRTENNTAKRSSWRCLHKESRQPNKQVVLTELHCPAVRESSFWNSITVFLNYL